MKPELSALNILLMVRDETANDIPSLCREFGFPPDSAHYIWPHVQQLEHAGLIVDVGNERYKAAENLGKMQAALGLSLKQLAKLGPRSLVVEPYWGPPDTFAQPIDLFVVMPFLDSLKPVWEDHITNVARSLSLTLKRADDFFTARSVMLDVWSGICQARVIIADCTGRNPNVFYEIGLAHAVGKPVVLITQNRDDVPFDVVSLRYILYEYTPRGMHRFEQTLTESLKLLLGLW